MTDIEKANELAAICKLSDAEIQTLFQGERRLNGQGWPHEERRKAYNQMRMEDACE